MKLHLSILFGVLFLFIGVVVLPNIGFEHHRPDLIAILCIHIIIYNENDRAVLFQTWLIGLLKDALSVEIFGFQSLMLLSFSFILLRIKQSINLKDSLILYLLILLYTFQSQLLHSMIIFVRYEIDLTIISLKSAVITTIFSPFVFFILNLWHKRV